MSEENNYSSAAGDLENREFSANQSIPEIKTGISEDEIKPTSLGKATNFISKDNDEPALLPGYHEIWAENFPSKGLFYPINARFFIRAASVKEIRHFSTINEQDPFSIDEALNEILKGCLMMRYPGKQTTFKDLREEDRIYIIMTIRDLTFVNGENKIAVKKNCDECGHENEFVIGKDSFDPTILPDTIMKYYDEESRKFAIQTKSSGTIEMVAPSIGIMMEVTKYIRKQQEEGRKLDQSFLKVLPYLATDWRGFNSDKIKNLEIECMQWSDIKYQTMYALTDMARVGVKEIMRTECERCGTEVTTPISFPGGIKSLFVISDISGELL
jgi:hypothetical protein